MTWKQPVAFALTLFRYIHPDAKRPTNAYSCLLLTTDGPEIKASYMLSHIRENRGWDVTSCRWPNNSRRFEGSQWLQLRSQAVQEACSLLDTDTSETTCPVTRRHIADDWHLRQHRCENLNSCHGCDSVRSTSLANPQLSLILRCIFADTVHCAPKYSV
jgi:hypothetical protein